MVFDVIFFMSPSAKVAPRLLEEEFTVSCLFKYLQAASVFQSKCLLKEEK